MLIFMISVTVLVVLGFVWSIVEQYTCQECRVFVRRKGVNCYGSGVYECPKCSKGFEENHW